MSAPAFKPFLVTRRKLIALFSSKTLTDQIIKAGWVQQVRPGKPGRAALYDYVSAEGAAEKLRKGEEPQAQPTGGDRE